MRALALAALVVVACSEPPAAPPSDTREPIETARETFIGP